MTFICRRWSCETKFAVFNNEQALHKKLKKIAPEGIPTDYEILLEVRKAFAANDFIEALFITSSP